MYVTFAESSVSDTNVTKWDLTGIANVATELFCITHTYREIDMFASGLTVEFSIDPYETTGKIFPSGSLIFICSREEAKGQKGF
jgi:hypothetical protein